MRRPTTLQEWSAVAGIVGVAIVLIGVLSGVAGKIGDTLSGEPSREEFIAEADAVCQEFEESTGGGRLAGTTIGEQLASATQAHEAIEDVLPELRAIEAPDDLQVKYDQYLASIEDFDVHLVAVIGYLSEGDVERGQAALPQLMAAVERRASIAEEIGFAVCGGT